MRRYYLCRANEGDGIAISVVYPDIDVQPWGISGWKYLAGVKDTHYLCAEKKTEAGHISATAGQIEKIWFATELFEPVVSLGNCGDVSHGHSGAEALPRRLCLNQTHIKLTRRFSTFDLGSRSKSYRIVQSEPDLAAGKDAKASGARDMTRLCAVFPTAVIGISFSLRPDNTPVIHTPGRQWERKNACALCEFGDTKEFLYLYITIEGSASRQSTFNIIYRAWNDALWRCCARKRCMNNLHLRPDERHPGTLWKCSRRWRPEPPALNYRPKEAMLNGLKFLSKRQLRHMTYLFSVRVACTVGWLLSTETRRIFWI